MSNLKFVQSFWNFVQLKKILKEASSQNLKSLTQITNIWHSAMHFPEGLEDTPFRWLGPKLKLSWLCAVQFWSEPSEILKLRFSNTPKTVDFNIPW